MERVPRRSWTEHSELPFCSRPRPWPGGQAVARNFARAEQTQMQAFLSTDSAAYRRARGSKSRLVTSSDGGGGGGGGGFFLGGCCLFFFVFFFFFFFFFWFFFEFVPDTRAEHK